MRAAGFVSVLLLIAACSGPTAATGQDSHSPTPQIASAVSPGPVVSPSPAASHVPFVPPRPVAAAPSTPKPVAFSCYSKIASGATLALVTFRGSTDVVVRDITNLSKPVSRCAFKSCSQWCASYGPDFMTFVTATRVAYIVRSADGDGAMYLADLASRKTLLVRIWGPDEGDFWVFAWSPDGNRLTYISSNRWHVRSATDDVVLSALGNDLGYNFNPDVTSRMVGFSADGQYVALDQSIASAPKKNADGSFSMQAGALFKVVRLSDTKLVYSRKNGTMAAWAGGGAHLYFRVDSGLAEWDPINGARLVVPGLAWINPVAGADAMRIAFETVNAKGNHFAGQLRLTDQTLQAIPLSKLPRMNVTFLNPTLVWYAGESACSGLCPGYGETSDGPPLSGRTYLHDLITGSISPSVDTAVVDSWPHLGSQ